MEQNKSDFQRKVDIQIKEWELKLEKLRLKASEASGELEERYNGIIQELEPQIEKGKKKLEEVVDATDDAWDDIKDGAQSVWDEMKTTFNKVASRFDKEVDSDLI